MTILDGNGGNVESFDLNAKEGEATKKKQYSFLEFNDTKTLKSKMINNISNRNIHTAPFMPNNDLLMRMQEFIPKIRTNATSENHSPSPSDSMNIEINCLDSSDDNDISLIDMEQDGTNAIIMNAENSHQDSNQQYIEMNIGLGVFDLLPKKDE